MGTAWFNDDPDIRTEFKNLNIITPHIEAAYFAKKVVTRQENDELSVSFERIAHTFLGRDVYVIIKLANTSQVRNETFKLSLLTGNTTLTGTADQVLTLGETNQSNGSKYHTRLSNDPEVLRNPNQPVVQINNPVYNNLDDFSDTLIYKIPLRPRTRATFNTWATNIYQNLSLVNLYFRLESDAYMLRKQVPFLSSAFFASKSLTFEPTMDTSRLWSNTFTLRNSIVYEIYHGDNIFNTFDRETLNRVQVRKRVGRIDNNSATVTGHTEANPRHKVTYFYHDQYDNEHEVCQTERFRINQKRKISNIPALSTRGALLRTIDYTANRTAGEQIDATQLHIYENGTLGVGIRGDKWYENRTTQIYMVNTDIEQDAGMGSQTFSALNYVSGNLTITFGYKNTRRRYVNPDIFAAFIGTLAQFYESNSHNYVSGEGFAYEDGSCYPSSTHVNGVAGDLYYLSTDDTLARPLLQSTHFDYENQNDFNSLLYDFGFARRVNMLSENFINTAVGVTSSTILPHCQHHTNPRHNNHLHVQGFDHNCVHSIIPNV